MIPVAASIFACARDCSMSYGPSRQSKPIEAFKAAKTGSCGWLKRDTARHDDERMEIRPARPDDPAVDLLYQSALPYYNAYAGGSRRARAMLEAVFPKRGHAASFECCRVALASDEIVGVLAGFPVPEGDRLARRFVRLTVPRLPPWAWPKTLRHLRAAGLLSPHPPFDAYYVDALAVSERWRRRGIARMLLEDAARDAAAQGLSGLALDTGLHNESARALYRACGFREREVRRAPTPRAERAIGGPGFVAYFKAA
jgi:ribosomal protein S18 acetylase RimI-like enzyme